MVQESFEYDDNSMKERQLHEIQIFEIYVVLGHVLLDKNTKALLIDNEMQEPIKLHNHTN